MSFICHPTDSAGDNMLFATKMEVDAGDHRRPERTITTPKHLRSKLVYVSILYKAAVLLYNDNKSVDSPSLQPRKLS